MVATSVLWKWLFSYEHPIIYISDWHCPLKILTYHAALSRLLASDSRRKREWHPFLWESVGGWRKDEFQWMSLALVGDKTGKRPQNLCTSCPSWNVLSLHSSSFTSVPSPVWEDYGGMVLNRMYREGEWRGKSAISGSRGKMAVKPACVCCTGAVAQW